MSREIIYDEIITIRTYKEFVELLAKVATGFKFQSLDVRGNEITELPPEIGQLTFMQDLNNGQPLDYQTAITPGVEITPFQTEHKGRQLTINFWDFGGQDIMHTMHRCFLTSRTCYVVVLSNRQGNLMQRARFWLRNIDSFARGCSVIIAVNC